MKKGRTFMKDRTAPQHWLKITTIDTHTEGETFRVITDGYPELPGDSILARRPYAMENLDHLRTLLVDETRGNKNMYAALLVPPAVETADMGVLYLEPGGYATMCGHGTIGICTVLVETGIIEAREPETEIVLDTPAGLAEARVAVKNGKAESVTIRNVPSFLYKADIELDVLGVGHVRLDIACGGNFYAILRQTHSGNEDRRISGGGSNPSGQCLYYRDAPVCCRRQEPVSRWLSS
jgi:proline racemase